MGSVSNDDKEEKAIPSGTEATHFSMLCTAERFFTQKLNMVD